MPGARDGARRRRAVPPHTRRHRGVCAGEGDDGGDGRVEQDALGRAVRGVGGSELDELER